MPTGSFISGLMRGLSGSVEDTRKTAREQAQRQQGQELKLLEALASSDDPEVRAMALTGMVSTAQGMPKQKGLRGFLGELEGNPILPQIRQLIGTPVTETKETAPGITSKPIVPGSAAMPQHAMVEPEAWEGMSPPAVPPQISAGFGDASTSPARMETTTQPRQVFASAGEKSGTEAAAQIAGKYQGIYRALMSVGVPKEQAIEQAARAVGGLPRTAAGAGSYQSIAGELPDGTPAFGVFDRDTATYLDPDTGAPLEGFRPRSTTGSQSMGTDREALARATFGKPYARLTQQQQQQVLGAEMRRTGEKAYVTGANRGQAAIQTELGMPIGVQAGQTMGVTPTTALGSLSQVIPLTDDQRTRLTAAKALAGPVDEMIALVQGTPDRPGVLPPTAGLTGGLTAAAIVTKKRLQRDPDLGRLEGVMNRAVGNVAKVLAAESGRLTQQDVERAQKSLLNLQYSLTAGDTQESALAKLRDVRAAIQKITSDIKASQQAGTGGVSSILSPEDIAALKGAVKPPPPPPGGGF